MRDGTERLSGQDVAAADGVVALDGRGVRGNVSGDTVLIGNAALFEDAGGVEPTVLAHAEELTANGRTIMIVKRADRFLGVIGVMDTLRPGAGDAVRSLRAVGIDRTVMLSGDHQLVADSIARQVGLTEAWGDLMPEDKVTAIQRRRPTRARSRWSATASTTLPPLPTLDSFKVVARSRGAQ